MTNIPLATNRADATTAATNHPTDHNDLARYVNLFGTAPLNVKDSRFGATGDGSTDDTAAVQAALDAVPAAGGSVYFPPGTYIVQNLRVASSTAVTGAGIGATVLKLKNNATVITTTYWPYNDHRYIMVNKGATTTGASEITIQGIEFDGNVANNVAVEQTGCVALCGVQKSFVTDCYFRDVRAEGVILMVNTPGTIVENEDVHIENCILYNCGFVSGGPGLARQGIAVISGIRIVVRGITAETIAAYVVDFETDTSAHQFHNCIVSDIVGEDVAAGVAFITSDVGQSTDNFISNITLKDGPSGPLSWGIVLERQWRMIVRGLLSDYVYNSGSVYMDLCDDISVVDVQSMGSNNGGSGPAIQLTSSKRIFIQGCTLRDSAGSQTYAVRETTPTGPTTINGNHILDGSSGPALLVHADSRVYDAASGGAFKPPVRVAATSNVTISGPGATIDGVTMSAGPPQDRVLLTAQTTASQNGIYLWNGAAVAMTRASDANTAAKLTESLQVTVDEGTQNRDTIWHLASNKPITIGSTALRFTRIHPMYPVASQPQNSYFQPAAARMENLPRDQVQLSNQAALATGTVRVFPLGVLRGGDTLAALNVIVATTASAGITNSWGGIARLSDRAVLAISATSTATTAANTLKTFTFASPFTADKDELLVGFVMYQATTVPSLFGINQGNAVIYSATPVVNGTSNTGATTALSVGATLTAFTADTENIYAYAT
jgi:hypothetical protein